MTPITIRLPFILLGQIKLKNEIEQQVRTALNLPKTQEVHFKHEHRGGGVSWPQGTTKQKVLLQSVVLTTRRTWRVEQ